MNQHLDYSSPDFYPLALDFVTNLAQIVRFSEGEYRSASFLDERILAGRRPVFSAPLQEVMQLQPVSNNGADFIFHIGHSGSTLLSRLLGDWEAVLSVREPAILRALARSAPTDGAADPASRNDFDRRVAICLGLLARSYRPGQRVLIKATSFVSEIAAPLLEWRAQSRAILLYVAPRIFLATILGGEAARAELPVVSPDRARRLARRMGRAIGSLDKLSAGELAALGWTCEILSLADIAHRFGERVLWMDFDAFLANSRAGLTAALRFLHGDADPRVVATLLGSLDFHRYSKAPEHPYGSAHRRLALAEAGVVFQAEIERGLDWINGLCRESPAAADAIRAIARAPSLA